MESGESLGNGEWGVGGEDVVESVVRWKGVLGAFPLSY